MPRTIATLARWSGSLPRTSSRFIPAEKSWIKKSRSTQIKDPARQIKEIHPDDIDVRYISPDAAMLLDTTTIRGLSGGVDYNGTYKVIRVFVKEQGRWRAAGAGIAPIKP